MSKQNDQVQVHLTVHQDNEDLQIDFNYDTKNDNIDDVVKDLVENINLTPKEEKELKEMICKQIEAATHENDESSGDEIDDPSYTELLQKQRNQINEMNARHLAEQQELIQRLTRNNDDLLIF